MVAAEAAVEGLPAGVEADTDMAVVGKRAADRRVADKPAVDKRAAAAADRAAVDTADTAGTAAAAGKAAADNSAAAVDTRVAVAAPVAAVRQQLRLLPRNRGIPYKTEELLARTVGRST
jgi:hypothetical protein